MVRACPEGKIVDVESKVIYGDSINNNRLSAILVKFKIDGVEQSSKRFTNGK